MQPRLKQMLRNLPVSREVYLTEREAVVSELDRLRQALEEESTRLRGECVQLRATCARLHAEAVEARAGIAALHTAVEDLRWQVRVRDRMLVPPAESLAPHDLQHDIEASFRELAAAAPRAYALWRELLDVNARAYEGFPPDSCSVPGHEVANRFRQFLWPYLTGPVLDVGCGPQPVPWYLEGYPVVLIAGVDPLPAERPHPFAFVRGVAERLPWRDGTFETVIVSTSLDHVLLPDRALAEIRRVLKPAGHFVTWVSLVSGARPYDPYAKDVQPVDRYHLFHFDRPYFQRVTGAHFTLVDEVDADGLSFFCSFRPR